MSKERKSKIINGDKKEMIYLYCQSCSSTRYVYISKTNTTEDITAVQSIEYKCPHCNSQEVEIDYQLIDIIVRLNKMELKTTSCCAGHKQNLYRGHISFMNIKFSQSCTDLFSKIIHGLDNHLKSLESPFKIYITSENHLVLRWEPKEDVSITESDRNIFFTAFNAAIIYMYMYALGKELFPRGNDTFLKMRQEFKFQSKLGQTTEEKRYSSAEFERSAVEAFDLVKREID